MRFRSFLAVLLGVAVVAGCQGRLGTLRNIPVEDQQEVLAMLTTGLYDVHQCLGGVVIEPKNKDASLTITGSGCRTLEEGTNPKDVNLYPETGLREIVGPDGEVLGYVSYDPRRTTVGIGKGDNGGGRLFISSRFSGR